MKARFRLLPRLVAVFLGVILCSFSLAQKVTRFTVSPFAVCGGTTVTGVVTLSSTAPSGGSVVSISQNSGSSAAYPSSVTVASGYNSASFSIQTSAVSSITTDSFQANLSGSFQTVKFAVYPPKISAFTINPGNFYSGLSSTGTVTLSNPAGAGGLSVGLSSSTTDANVPSTITVPAGQTTATFTVTAGVISGQESAIITATENNRSVTATIGIYPAPLVSITISPAVIYPYQLSTGTVTLDGVALAGGDTVSLSTSGPLYIPRTLTIPAGQSSASFSLAPIGLTPGSSITAGLGNRQVSATVQVISNRLMPSAWPKGLGDLFNSGRGQGSGASGNIFWQARNSGYGLPSSPVIAQDGTIYLVTQDGNLTAYDGLGNEQWAQPLSVGTRSTPAIGSDGTIYVGSSTNAFYAFNSDGSPKWSITTDSSTTNTSPAIANGDTVYFASQDSFYAVDGQLGTIIWQNSIHLDFPASSQTPAIGTDGTIYETTKYGGVTAFNPDGSSKFLVYTSQTISSAPSIGTNGNVYVADANGFLFAVDGQTGSINWSLEINDLGAALLYPPAVGGDGTLFLACSDGKYRSLDPATGNLNWEISLNLPNNPHPCRGGIAIGSDGTLYFGDATRVFYAVSSFDGTIWWDIPLVGEVQGSPAIGLDGTIYALDTSGEFTAFH